MDGEQPHRPGVTRRQTLAGAAGLALGSAAQAQAQVTETARGTVSEEGGVGLPGVMVSNGRDVVTTGPNGFWSLPVTPGDAIFVIKPSGFMTPVDPVTQLPRFSYLHVPDGTPASLGFRFAGLAASGKLPDSIDFPLRRQPEADSFKALLFTDPQPESLAELGYVRDDVVAATAGIDAAFGITHGDVMFDDLSLYGRSNRIVGSIGLPWYNCCGNHDMNLEAPDDTHSRETFQRVFGARYSAFQYGPATFLLLDNVDYLGTDPKKPNGYGRYQGRFGARQLEFVRNVLANVPRDALVVISHHIPLRTAQGSEPNNANTDTREFLAAISTHPNSVSFSGHTHTNEHWYFGESDGFTGGTHHHHVLTAASGSWWSGPFDEAGIPVALATDGSPNGFHILSVDGNRYTTTLVPAHDRPASQMRIVLDSQLHRDGLEVMKEVPAGSLLNGPIMQAATASTRLVVNLFDGGPRSNVTFQIGWDSAALPMNRVLRRDPFVDEVYARNPDTKKPWVNAGPCTHLWQATLPAELPVGVHRIAVRASDEHGRKHLGWMVLEVTV